MIFPPEGELEEEVHEQLRLPLSYNDIVLLLVRLQMVARNERKKKREEQYRGHIAAIKQTALYRGMIVCQDNWTIY